ncbi:MAG: tyrosine-type recombinase/integrase [Candidatus Dormiibacterota bacterium]
MTDLAAHLQDYLRLRRALGYKLEYPGFALPTLISYLDAADSRTLTTELAIEWAKLPQGVQPIHWAKRLSAARRFARYLQTIDPATEVPPRDIFDSRQQRPAPYLWSDTDIRHLVDAARLLKPELHAASCGTLFGLLAASGMRIGEALALARGDVNIASGIVSIRDGKFGRARLVPLHESTAAALDVYANLRDRICPKPQPNTFFLSAKGNALSDKSVRPAFNRITTDLGLRTAVVRPRIHDLRHTFAVRTLINWQRAGADVDGLLPKLSTLLGHVDPVSTYWYLQASPELMELAATRYAGRFGVGP